MYVIMNLYDVFVCDLRRCSSEDDFGGRGSGGGGGVVGDGGLTQFIISARIECAKQCTRIWTLKSFFTSQLHNVEMEICAQKSHIARTHRQNSQPNH